MLFEQENLSYDLEPSEKTKAINYIFKQLPDLWKKGYLLLPDAKFDNIGAKLNNGLVTIYLFDWHFESDVYSNIFEQTCHHIQWLIAENQITRDNGIEIISLLIKALETENISETLENTKQIEDRDYPPDTFFKEHKKSIELQASYSQNKKFLLTNKGGLLSHQQNLTKLIIDGKSFLSNYLKSL